MKKYLIIETFPNTPHLETSLEIMQKLKKGNNKVFFFWSGYDLPWKDWDLPLYKKILLFSFESKIKKVYKYLNNKNIETVPKITLSENKKKYINNYIKKIKNFKNLKKLKYKNSFSVGSSCLSSLISRYHFTNIENYRKIIPKVIESGCLVYERSIEAIENINPDYVITFNSRFIISKPIVDATKKSKKKLLIHERGSAPNKYMLHSDDIFNKFYIHKLIKRHWNLNKNRDKKINIAKKYFMEIQKKKFFKSMGLHFEKGNNKLNFEKKKEIITFFCSTDHEYSSIDLPGKKANFFLNKKWNNQINSIKSVVKNIKNDKNKFLYIKSHPNFSKKSNIEYELKKMECFNIKYLSVKDSVDTIDLINNTDLVITYGSTLELFCLYLNKRVISMFKGLYCEFDIFNYPKNEKSLNRMINGRIKYKKNYLDKLYKIAYFFKTFGIKYEYFQPDGYFRGHLKEKEINHLGPLINLFTKLKLLKY